MKFYLIAAIFLNTLVLPAQHETNISGITFRYEVQDDSVYCFLSAPTKGWVMVGFNNKNTTNSADLKFFAVQDDQVITADHKNTGGRNYPNDLSLRGKNDIHTFYGFENNVGTQVIFALPLMSNDENDFQHQPGKHFWLILAYSLEDDFQHHSIVRKHLPFTWESL